LQLLQILKDARQISNGVESDFKKEAMKAIGTGTKGKSTKGGLFKELFTNAKAIENVPKLLREEQRMESNKRAGLDQIFGRGETAVLSTEKQPGKKRDGINPLQLAKQTSKEVKRGSAQLLKVNTVDDHVREARKAATLTMDMPVCPH
jgi:hypothetical protein